MEKTVSIKVMRDGNSIGILLGENLHVGIAGFGNTFLEALDDFMADYMGKDDATKKRLLGNLVEIKEEE